MENMHHPKIGKSAPSQNFFVSQPIRLKSSGNVSLGSNYLSAKFELDPIP